MEDRSEPLLIDDDSILAPGAEYRYCGGRSVARADEEDADSRHSPPRVSTAYLYHREATRSSSARAADAESGTPSDATLANAPALPSPSADAPDALDAEETLLALLLHREAHDARFAEALRATGTRPLLYVEPGRRRRLFGVDARRKQGGNLYGEALRATRDSANPRCNRKVQS